MAKFECSLCGKCCTSFGEFIRIERQLNGRDYYCRDGTTGEIFFAHVQPEFADEIEDRFLGHEGTGCSSSKKGCVFLCRNPEGDGFVCAAYPARPAICRNFRCYRMIIRQKPGGEILGKVIGMQDIRTRDEALLSIWNGQIATIPHAGAARRTGSNVSDRIGRPGSDDDSDWVKAVTEVLARHGYYCENVE